MLFVLNAVILFSLPCSHPPIPSQHHSLGQLGPHNASHCPALLLCSYFIIHDYFASAAFPFRPGVHNLQDLMPDDLGWSRCNNKKNEVYKKVTCLNHPETIGHPLLHRKIFFHKACPWCQKGWGLLLFLYSVSSVASECN